MPDGPAKRPGNFDIWVYVSSKEVERGLSNIEDSIDASIWGLEDYFKKTSQERLITPTRRKSTDNIMINWTTTRKQMGRKTTVWIFQETNWQNLPWEEPDMAKKGKLLYLLILAQEPTMLERK